MDIILIKLIMAHLIGDFFLQPDSWVKDREEKRWRSGKLYLHILVHIGLIFLLFFNIYAWKLALSIGILHLVIDAGKALLQGRYAKRLLFFLDQAFHLVSILGVWVFFYKTKLNLSFLYEVKFWVICSGILFLWMPSSIIMRVIINKWIPTQTTNPQSLQSAGKYIGVLERLLIFLFVLTNHFDAVGFLLAAKSIFRFGDLKDAHDIKLTEYVLIGTLLSFGIAIATAMTVLKFIA